MKQLSAVPDGADWTLRDADLARKYGVSREAVRQRRNHLNKPKSLHHRLPSLRGVALRQWMEANLHLSPYITIEDLYRQTGSTLCRAWILKVAHTLNFKFAGSPRWFERIPINFELPNADLEHIWHLSHNLVGATRQNYDGLPRVRWTRRGSPPDDPLYHAAIKAEKAKARRHR